MNLERNVSRMHWFYKPQAGPNFGDWIGPLLYKKRRGHDPIYTEHLGKGVSDVFFTCGSILHKITQADRAIVWGSGAIESTVRFERPRSIRAVRGPLTRDICLSQGYDCPEVYGDPGLLLPEVYQPQPGDTRWRVGLVPHYVDLPGLSALFADQRDLKIIDVKRDVTKVVDDIASCDAIVSTSLHGVIVALAYGIPAVFAKFSDKVIGGSFKFDDFYLGAGVKQPPAPVLLRETVPSEALIDLALAAPTLPGEPAQGLMACCPF